MTINYRSEKEIIDFYNDWMTSTDEKFVWKNFRFPKKIVPGKKDYSSDTRVVKCSGKNGVEDWYDSVYDFVISLKHQGVIKDYNQVAFLCKSVKNDKNYADYLFEHAGPAIMSWIIEGAKRAIDKNFHTTLPDVVEAAIQAYREDNDWLGQFLEECCEIDPSYKEKSGELYQAYRAHCMQNGEYIRSTTDFYSSMDKAGYNRIRKNTGVQVVGLKLKEGQDFLE